MSKIYLTQSKWTDHERREHHFAAVHLAGPDVTPIYETEDHPSAMQARQDAVTWALNQGHEVLTSPPTSKD